MPLFAACISGKRELPHAGVERCHTVLLCTLEFEDIREVARREAFRRWPPGNGWNKHGVAWINISGTFRRQDLSSLLFAIGGIAWPYPDADTAEDGVFIMLISAHDAASAEAQARLLARKYFPNEAGWCGRNMDGVEVPAQVLATTFPLQIC